MKFSLFCNLTFKNPLHDDFAEEIQTQPKLRNCSSKLQQSPKFRKGKHEEDAENGIRFKMLRLQP